MISIAIVDDQQLFRESLVNLLSTEPDIHCLLQCGNGADFLTELSHNPGLQPSVLLLDLEMPVMNGVELNKILQEQYPDIKVVILSVHANQRLISSLIKDGADGYLTKNCDKEELVNAIRMLHHNGYYINKMTLQAMQQNNTGRISNPLNINNIPVSLSKRETEILQLICMEYSNAEIAAKLFLSARTVEGHRNNLLSKVGCKNSAGLVLFAIRHHIFSVPF